MVRGDARPRRGVLTEISLPLRKGRPRPALPPSARLAGLTLTLLLAAACGGGQEAAPETSSAPSSPASSSASTSGILSFDATAKTVSLKIVAGARGGFNFNGFSNGAMNITVPAGWAVTVSCSNEAPAPHSCAVVAPGSSTPAFANSSTPNPTVGLAQGQSQSFTFTPDKPGTFRLACLVAGHEDAGMWDAFTVAAGGQPSISPP